MKKIEEQLDSIEEVLTHLVKKVSVMEETAGKIKKDDSTWNMLADMQSSLEKIPSGHQLRDQMAAIKKSIDSLPKQSQVKHHHHFDVFSKGFIISVLALLLIAGICMAVAISYYNENSRLEGNDIKYRMIRQMDPAIASRADSIYHRNPGSALRETRRREDFELVLKDAQANFNEKQKEVENARKLLKALKRK